MKKLDALQNALAVLNYALWRYNDEIVSFTSYTINYDVTIQFHRDSYNIDFEDQRLREVIAAGAKIEIIEVEDKDYDIYCVTYLYKD